MSEVRTARPTGITIIGWLWIAAGVLMGFSAALAGVAYSMMRQMGKSAVPDAGLPPEFALMNFVSENLGVFLVLQCVVALISIWAGAGLLRLRAWARAAIEALSWLGLLYTVGFGVYWLYMWISMAAQMPNGSGPIELDAFQTIGAVLGVVVTASFAIPLGIMIWYLRGKEAREAVAQAKTVRE